MGPFLHQLLRKYSHTPTILESIDLNHTQSAVLDVLPNMTDLQSAVNPNKSKLLEK